MIATTKLLTCCLRRRISILTDILCRVRLDQIQLTGEQQRILSHDVQADHVVKIIAFAGMRG